MNLPVLPAQNVPISEGSGLFSRVWFLFLNALVGALNDLQSTISTAVTFVWKALPALQNSWVAANTGSGSYFTPSYSKSTNFLCLSGQLSGGTIADGTLICTLPTADSPPHLVSCTVRSATAAFAVWGQASLFVFPSGAVILNGAPAATVYLTIHAAIPLLP